MCVYVDFSCYYGLYLLCCFGCMYFKLLNVEQEAVMNAGDHALVISPTKPKPLKGNFILYSCTL